MSRRKMILPLTALTALTMLSGCTNNLVKSKGNVITMTIDGVKTIITAEHMFDEYLNTANGIQKYYDAVYEAVVREEFEKNQNVKKAEAYDYADGEVEQVKRDAKENAEAGGSYDEELEKLLESAGVEKLNEYREQKAYVKMKETIRKQFFDSGESSWAPGAWDELVNGVEGSYEGFLENQIPYHIRHILVKVDAENNKLYSGKITKDNANKLGSTIKLLAERGEYDTFGKIAQIISDDSSSSQYGEVDVLTRDTNYVNEFKLGIYAYDAIFANEAEANKTEQIATKADKLNIPTFAVDHLQAKGIGKIPYEAALKMIDVQDLENPTLNTNSSLRLEKEVFYPRNVYFNKYFNNHNVAVITPNSVDPSDVNGLGTVNSTFESMNGFNEVPELGAGKFLTDEKGNPILVTRAGSGYEGVHFMIIERSALAETENGISLADYYTVKTPDNADFPKDASGNELTTYVNFFKQDTSSYNARANTIRTKIESFDNKIDDRIFEKLIDKLNIKFKDADLEKRLFDYLDDQYQVSLYDQDVKTTETWTSWIDYLVNQDIERQRLIPETYVQDFIDGKEYK